MTCREKLAKEHPENIRTNCDGGCWGCPSDYGYLNRPDECSDCTKCWDREIPGTEKTKEKDMHYADYNYLKTKSYEELIDIAIEDDLRIRDRDERIVVMEKQIEDLDSSNKRYLRALEAKNVWIGTLEGKLKDKDEEIDRLIKNAVNKEEKIEELKRIIESKNGRIGTLKQKITNYDRDIRCLEKEKQNLNEKNELLLKDNQYVRDANRLSAEKDKEKIESLEARLKVFEDEWSELKEKNESLKKDITQYRIRISERNSAIDNQAAKIHDMQDTIDFQERHINRIEGELKLYKGMHVDTNKTDYNKCSVEPLCKSVPASAVIGKIHSLNSMATDEEPNLTFKLHKDAVKKITGKDSWSDIDYLIMPNEEYESEIIRRVNQCIYYSKLLPKYLSATSSEKAPVGIVNSIKIKSQASKYYAKYESLKSSGFTEDQAMQLLPIWTDDEEE